ncbi:hypothetical protein C2G38_2199984 [Gigaspora rosea]|uniref:Uncharacterized protein n=1 Tax=Gigaspora rosea TaxID=44941 RepID=A0A397UYP6_9GLOM|nr:hypothetical protein C2G38_2199984 [Gigaspora rosea]
MNSLQFEENELSSINLSYNTKIIKIFDENSSDEEGKELALKIYEGQTFQT